MSSVSQQRENFARERSEQIGEARSILADPRLERWVELRELVRDSAHEEVLSYIYDAGIRRLRRCQTTAWTNRFSTVLEAYERRGHDLSLERILRKAKNEKNLRTRIAKLALRERPLHATSFDALLGCTKSTLRGAALEALHARLSTEQLERYIQRHGVDRSVLEAAHLGKMHDLSLVEKLVPELLLQIGEEFDYWERSHLWEMLEPLTLATREHRDCIARHLEQFDQEHHGMLDMLLDLEQRAWLSQWYGRPYPDYSTRSPRTPTRSRQQDSLEALAARLRRQSTEARLDTFFDELGLDRYALTQKVWERIANAIDHAPTHEERLRLTSLLLKAGEKPRNYPKLDQLTRHWTEHGSGGATRRAGHKGSRRSNRGASQRASIRRARQQGRPDDRSNPEYGGWPWWSYHYRSGVTWHPPDDSAPRGIAIARDIPCDAMLDELSALNTHHITRLDIQNFQDYPKELARVLEHTRLQELEQLAISTSLEHHPGIGVLAGNITWNEPRAKDRFYASLSDAWLAHMIDALASSHQRATIATLMVGDDFIGPRTFRALRAYLNAPDCALHTLGISGVQLDDAAFVEFLDDSELSKLTSFWAYTNSDHYYGEHIDYCEIHADLLPEHLR